MPEGEILDARDDGANGTEFGYLRVISVPPKTFPTVKLFKQPDGTPLVAGQLVRYNVEAAQITLSGQSFTLPVATIEEVLSSSSST
ncbi:hypothetical protein [Flexithrix dorotheae]|uniref:hypothetical protein n=1 Tax=Flexithrix dorotheae TaxID=70993 RepID=UPI0003734C46|nr:hypothetical protein [Flexithrix dorotheae]